MTIKSAQRIVFLISSPLTHPLPSKWKQNTVAVICETSSLKAESACGRVPLPPHTMCMWGWGSKVLAHNKHVCHKHLAVTLEVVEHVKVVQNGAVEAARVYPIKQWRIRIDSRRESNCSSWCSADVWADGVTLDKFTIFTTAFLNFWLFSLCFLANSDVSSNVFV